MAKKASQATKELELFKQALRALKVKPNEVFSHREYGDKIVIVTKSGQKHIWERK